jgi:hypothetical protein
VVFAARIGLAVGAAVTLWFALYPGPNHPHLLSWDKAEHVLAFSTLTVLLLGAAPRVPPIWAMTVLAIFGGSIELLQATPLVDRDADLFDWLVELPAIGVAAAAFLLTGVRRWLAGPGCPGWGLRRGAG